MAERWVVNASPLIVLSKINYQHLLTELAAETVIPEAVALEIEAGPEDDPARRFLRFASLPIVTVHAEPVILAWDLGAEEGMKSWRKSQARWNFAFIQNLYAVVLQQYDRHPMAYHPTASADNEQGTWVPGKDWHAGIAASAKTRALSPQQPRGDLYRLYSYHV